MDMIKTKPMAFEQVLQDLSGKRTVAGAKQIRKAMTSGKATCVYLALDADPAITEPLLALSQQYNIAAHWVKTKINLGQACGIEVGAAAAAAVD